MFSERTTEPTESATLNHTPNASEELTTLQDTLHIIDTALIADDFNEDDREEIEKNREFFEARYNTIIQIAGQSIKSARIAA